MVFKARGCSGEGWGAGCGVGLDRLDCPGRGLEAVKRKWSSAALAALAVARLVWVWMDIPSVRLVSVVVDAMEGLS